MTPKGKSIAAVCLAAVWNGVALSLALDHQLNATLAVVLNTPALVIAARSGWWRRQEEVVEILARLADDGAA